MFSYVFCLSALGNFLYLEDRVVEFLIEATFASFICNPRKLCTVIVFNLTQEFTSLLFSHSVTSDSLRPHGRQHSRPPCPSPTPRVYSNSCPSSQWCHPTISSSVIHFSCLQSFPESGSFPKSQLFASGGPSIGASSSAMECLWIHTSNYNRLNYGKDVHVEYLVV